MAERGPHLALAVICERVLTEADGVISLIRIIDRSTVTTQAPTDAEAALLPPPVIPLNLVLGFKSGDSQGPLDVTVRIETPSGFKWPDLHATLTLEGEDRGNTLVMPMNFPAQDNGLYWFVVEAGGETITKIPLRITKQTFTQSTPPQLPGI